MSSNCASIRLVKFRHPFQIEAMVVLPEHLHAIWELPEGDADFATRWALIKAGFSRSLPCLERLSPSRTAKGGRGIWQRRF
jgi:putative transposase